MKTMIAALTVLMMGCTSISRPVDTKTRTFSDFLKVPLGSSEDLLKMWGPPASRESKEIAKREYAVWSYEKASEREIAEFSLDPSAQLIVEKIYLPEARSEEAILSALLKSKPFTSMTFQKIPVRCAHFGETIYAAEQEGVLVISNDKERATVAAIAFMTPEVFQLELRENQERRCR